MFDTSAYTTTLLERSRRRFLPTGFLHEVPLAVGVIVSGIIMAILVDRLSVLHITKIALASCSMIGLAFCVKGVLRRNRILQGSPTEEGIIREARKMYLTALTAECLLIPILVLGFWLGYHRILDSIY